MYGDGHPVRLANDRYEQFQTSLKRHAFKMNYAHRRRYEDRPDAIVQGRFRRRTAAGAAIFRHRWRWSARPLRSRIYYFPKSDLTRGRRSRRGPIDAGSARGYGTLQSMAATEMMVDEIAARLNRDPIEFRLANALRSGMKNTQGAIAAGAIRVEEVLQKAQRHPLWTARASRKARI